MKFIVHLAVLLFLTPFIWSQEAIKEIGALPNEVHESSGLIFYNGVIVTHNDSGNDPQLFEIDTVSLQIKRTITISGAENNDWEDIDQDDEYIYVGDFGNNLGTRQNLAIYRISKLDYDKSETVSAEKINFSYEDQTNFENNGNSDWDAEALFVMNDQLIVLTKQWKSNGTVAYMLPKVPGTYIAKRLDAYKDLGLVTGATYNNLSKALVLIGYSPFLSPFIVIIEGATTSAIFGGKVESLNLDIGIAQIEGITFTATNSYLCSSELFTRATPAINSRSRLFSINIKNKEGVIEVPKEPENPKSPAPEPEKDQLVLFSISEPNFLQYKLTTEEYVVGRAIYDTSGKRISYDPIINLNEDPKIDLSMLETSIYYLTFYLGGNVISRPFYRY